MQQVISDINFDLNLLRVNTPEYDPETEISLNYNQYNKYVLQKQYEYTQEIIVNHNGN